MFKFDWSANWALIDDSTPKDKPLIVGKPDPAGWVCEAEYHAEQNGWWAAGTDPTDYHDGQLFPTHWMPMPPIPKAEGA